MNFVVYGVKLTPEEAWFFLTKYKKDLPPKTVDDVYYPLHVQLSEITDVPFGLTLHVNPDVSSYVYLGFSERVKKSTYELGDLTEEANAFEKVVSTFFKEIFLQLGLNPKIYITLWPAKLIEMS
jgi:hypothetical protein